MEKKVKILKDDNYSCDVAFFEDLNLTLESGYKLDELKVAFKTYGNLNKNRSNAILICHALTADQFLADKNPITKKDGWWSRMVGPNKPIDTNKFFVICSNVIGGCSGSSGPKEIDKKSQMLNLNKIIKLLKN